MKNSTRKNYSWMKWLGHLIFFGAIWANLIDTPSALAQQREQYQFDSLWGGGQASVGQASDGLTRDPFVSFGSGTFNNPQGIAVDATGNVYVADTGRMVPNYNRQRIAKMVRVSGRK